MDVFAGDMRKLGVLEKKRREELGVIGTAIGPDQIRLKKQTCQGHRRCGTAFEAVVQRAAYNRRHG